MPEPLIAFENVLLRSPSGRTVFSSLNWEVGAGERIRLGGARGGGASALLRLVTGLAHPERGRVVLNGVPHVETRFDHPYLLQGEVAWIPQEGGLIANLTLLQNVALPLRFVRRKGRGDAEEMARLFLNRVGLQEKASLRPHALSLRERRLGALARSAALGPRLWLVDRLLDGLEPGSLSLAGNLLEEVLRPEEVTLLLVGDETGSGGLAHKAVRLEEGSVHQEEPE